MATPFDPSKLNLDINSDDTPVESEPSTLTQETETLDILDNIEVKTELSSSSSLIPAEPADETVQDTSSAHTDAIGTQESAPVIAPQTKEPENIEPAAISSEETEGTAVAQPVEKAVVEIAAGEVLNEKQKIIDINIANLENIITLIDEKSYDYVLIEPEDTQVKITFKQDNVDRDVRYIKYPVYTSILFKIKQSAGLIMEDTGSAQEGNGSLKVGAKTFKLATKTAPGQNGERIWLKVKEDTSIKNKKQVKKQSLGMIFGFLAAILFIGLILGGAFIAFIVVNAKTVEDVKFFANLGINLNDINTFISS